MRYLKINYSLILFCVLLNIYVFSYDRNSKNCDSCGFVGDILNTQRDLGLLYKQSEKVKDLSYEKQLIFWNNKLKNYLKDHNLRLVGLVHLKLGILLNNSTEKIPHLTDLSIYRHTTLANRALEEIFMLIDKDPELALSLDYFFKEIKLEKDYSPLFSKKLFYAYFKNNNFSAANSLLKEVENVEGNFPWISISKIELLYKEKKENDAKILLKRTLKKVRNIEQWKCASRMAEDHYGKNYLVSLLGVSDAMDLGDGFLSIGENRLSWECYSQCLDYILKTSRRNLLRVRSASAACGAGEWKEAIQLAKKFRPKNRMENATKYWVLALSYRKIGKERLFKKYAHRFGRLSPLSRMHLRLLRAEAFDYEVEGDIKKASRCYRRIWKLFPNTPEYIEALWKLGWWKYIRKKWKKSADYFLRVAREDKYGTYLLSAIYWYGVCLEKMDKYKDAYCCFKSLNKAFPYSYYGELSELHISGKSITDREQNLWFNRIQKVILNKNVELTKKNKNFNSMNLKDFNTRISFAESLSIGLFDEAGKILRREYFKNKNSNLASCLAWLSFKRADVRSYIYFVNRACINLFSNSLDTMDKQFLSRLFPLKYLDRIRENLKGAAIDPLLLLGLIRQESAFQVNAMSGSGAMGLMQLMPKTAAQESEMSIYEVKSHLFDPDFNIKIGCKHLKKLLREFNGNIPFALAAYNGGKKRIERILKALSARNLKTEELIEFIPMSQSRQYVKSIFRNYNYYCILYRGTKADIRIFLGK